MRTLAAPDFETLQTLLPVEIDRYRDDDALQTVTVVTPGDLAREEARRDLARRSGGMLGVPIIAFGDWIRNTVADEIGRRDGRELGEAGLGRLVARLLDESAPRPGRTEPFRGASRTAGLDRAVTRSLQDLRRGGWSARALGVAFRPAPDALRAELLRLLRDLESTLETERLWDRRRRERLAADSLRSRADPPPLIFFGFHELPPSQREVVAGAAAAGPVTLFVPGPGGAGETAAVSLIEWARDLGSVEFAETESSGPLTLREGLFEKPTLTDPGPTALELHTFPNEAAEVRGIARRILREVEEGSRAFDEFLVVVTVDGPSPSLFRRIFARAEVPARHDTRSRHRRATERSGESVAPIPRRAG